MFLNGNILRKIFVWLCIGLSLSLSPLVSNCIHWQKFYLAIINKLHIKAIVVPFPFSSLLSHYCATFGDAKSRYLSIFSLGWWVALLMNRFFWRRPNPIFGSREGVRFENNTYINRYFRRRVLVFENKLKNKKNCGQAHGVNPQAIEPITAKLVLHVELVLGCS